MGLYRDNVKEHGNHYIIIGYRGLSNCQFSIPGIVIIYGTSNGPQNDIGNYLGLINPKP